MIITPIQNTGANGYGLHPTKRNFLLTLWEEFYGLTFASFDEAKADTSGRYLKLPDNNYFDTAVYKKRMAAIIEPFLFDANERAKTHSKKAYVHVVGLGLGAWQKLNAQGTLLAEVYADILSKHSFPFIADIDFSWFPKEVTSIGGVNNNKIFNAGANNIVIHFSKRNPAELLSGPNKGKLLVAQYAWDSNSYPGNEYWLGALSATGDPAAASCSTIPELQNPEINENVAGAQTRAYGG
jgi:hypothetical protein